MARIAQVIQQGTNRNSQEVAKIGDQMHAQGQAGRQAIKDTMEIEAFELQKQAIYDEKAGGWMQTHAAIKNNESMAKGRLETAQQKIATARAKGADPTEITKLESEIPALEGAVAMAAGQMGKLLAGTTGDVRMSEILRRSSYNNADLDQILNGVMDDPTIPDAYKQQINANVSVMQQVQQQLAETEQAEQVALKVQQAGDTEAARTRAQLETMKDVTDVWTKGQLNKDGTTKTPEDEKSQTPGKLIAGLGADNVTEDTPLSEDNNPELNANIKVTAAKVKALGLKEEHFNLESDKLNDSFIRMYKQWGEEVTRATAANEYPDPQVLADTMEALQDEIANTGATPQAKTMYDELAQLIGKTLTASKGAKGDKLEKASLALGAIIERTKTEFPVSTKGRANKLKARSTQTAESVN